VASRYAEYDIPAVKGNLAVMFMMTMMMMMKIIIIYRGTTRHNGNAAI
jgi:hypothetical protein